MCRDFPSRRFAWASVVTGVSMSDAGSMLMAAGPAVFLVGAAIGVPTYCMSGDAEARMRLLTDHRTGWQVAQPLYAAGPVLAVIGSE